jgi:ribonuclease HI
MEEQLDLFGTPLKVKKVVIKPVDEQPEAKKPPLPKKRITLLVYVDGAARGNPGPSGAGVYIATQDNVPLVKKGYYLHHKTNNQAEYLAFIFACLHIHTLIKNEPPTHIIFHSDSQLLVRQIQGIYKVKNEILIGLHFAAQKLLNMLHFSIVHVDRESNTVADHLANLGVDKKTKVSQAMAAELAALGIKIS